MKPQDLHEHIRKSSALLRDLVRQERALMDGAQRRLEAVQQQLAGLRPRVHTDRDAADRYLRLTEEKGALLRTLGKS